MKKIILDGFGGDNSPFEIVKGAVEALSLSDKYTIVITGNEDKIKEELGKYSYDTARIDVLPSTSVITNDDIPTDAIRSKKDSSLIIGLDYLKAEEDAVGFVSAGPTGAVLAGSIFRVGRIKGIARPALCPVLPTVKGGQVLMLDIGANVDCKPEFLDQFAIMGSAYQKCAMGNKNPKVGLLSNGTEDKKGNALNKEAFPILKANKNINFVGNMEAREILSGDVDVVVTDGFAGNVALKGTEGAVLSVLSMLKTGIMGSFMAKIGALFMKKVFKKLKNTLDYNKNGGAVLLGIEKVIVKSHGSSKSQSISSSILQAYNLYESNFIQNIKDTIKNED